MARTSPSFRRWEQRQRVLAVAADDRAAGHDRALADGAAHSCAHGADTRRHVEADRTPRWTARRRHSLVKPRFRCLSRPLIACKFAAARPYWAPVRWGDLVPPDRIRLMHPERSDRHWQWRRRAADHSQSPSKSPGAPRPRQHLHRQSSRSASHHPRWSQQGHPDKDWVRRLTPRRDGRADAGLDHDGGDVDVRSCCLVE